MTQSFGNLQEQTYRAYEYPSSKTGTSWSRLVVGLFLNFFESLWEKRNSIIPPKNDKQNVQTYLQGEVRAIRERHTKIPTVLKPIFKKGEKFQTDKNAKVTSLRRWVDLMRDLKKFFKLKEENDRTLGRDIREYCSMCEKQNP